MEESKQVTITNRLGLHARPAAEFVKLANKFDSEVWVSKDEITVSGKSIMGMMMLAAESGSSVEIRAEGADAPEAIEALADLVTSGFGEEEG